MKTSACISELGSETLPSSFFEKLIYSLGDHCIEETVGMSPDFVRHLAPTIFSVASTSPLSNVLILWTNIGTPSLRHFPSSNICGEYSGSLYHSQSKSSIIHASDRQITESLFFSGSSYTRKSAKLKLRSHNKMYDLVVQLLFTFCNPGFNSKRIIHWKFGIDLQTEKAREVAALGSSKILLYATLFLFSEHVFLFFFIQKLCILDVPPVSKLLE